MDLQVESDIYEPNVNEEGNYSDYLPKSSKFINGVRCPCGSRKEHIFDNRSSFASHIRSKTHQKWIVDLNLNKANHYCENIRLTETLTSQRIIIAKLQRENDENLKLIVHLTKKIENILNPSQVDLLNID